uniref:Uncharacterized protein n=1 Tax=Picea sitchensis TaxID=3332 RepID=A9NKW0_PICSI|nr:unknown [Picea sitchensis]
MESCKKPKRLFELESCAWCQQEGSQNEINRHEVKRQRTALGSTEDNFEEFVALINRIRYMKNKHMNFSICDEESIGEVLDVQVIRNKSPCLPSFEWEDFCVPAQRKNMPAQRDMCSFDTKDNLSSSEEKGKQGIPPANYLKTDSSSDAYYGCPAESFDLNVEASLNI